MCGIAGYIGKKNIDHERILNTLELMRRRGPDHQGYFSVRENGLNVLLLHSRLAIIDLEQRANQPFTIGGNTIVFNGEIYNYSELKGQLGQCGNEFKTESDTEVLLQSYRSYGEDCVRHFEGMWAFAIYDKDKGRLLLSRDRFAEKPLYLYREADGIFFGSEIKFIRSLADARFSINEKHLLRYLTHGYKALYKTSETFFHGIEEVPRATNMLIDSQLHINSVEYWSPCHRPVKMTLQEAIEGVRDHLLESIKIRLRADAPLAFCLSGGVDSGAIASIAVKKYHYDVAAFSIIDTDKRYNESENITSIIGDLKCRHTMISMAKDSFSDRLRQLISYHDSPVATISYYVHSFLSETMAQKGYRVSISGTGADELLAGYYDHFNLHLYEMQKVSSYQDYLKDWKRHIARFVRNPYLKNPELYLENPDFRGHIYLNDDIFRGFLNVDFSEDFTEVRYCDSLLRNRMLNEMFHEIVPVILHEDDLNSMFYSIENRSPFLDSRLFAFTNSIPSEYLIKDGYGKYLLREAVKDILHDQIRLDRRKVGFNASIHSVVDFDKKETAEIFLDHGRIFDFVKRENVEQLIKQSPLSNSYNKFLFNFISAKMFLELN